MLLLSSRLLLRRPQVVKEFFFSLISLAKIIKFHTFNKTLNAFEPKRNEIGDKRREKRKKKVLS